MSDDVKSKLDLISQQIQYVANDCTEIKTEQKEQTLKLHDHDIKLAEYNKQLEIHIKATEILKNDLSSHKKQSENQYNSLSDEIKPIVDTRKGFKALKKTILTVGAVAGSLIAIFKFLGMF